jgi:GTPase-activating protein
MTLYTNALPFKLVVRLFDSFLNEKFKIVYRVALAIFKIKEKALLECKSMDKIMDNLKQFKEPEFQDDDLFISIAFKIKLSRKDIEVYIEKRE